MPKYIIQSHDYSQTAVISLIVQPDYDALTNVMNFPNDSRSGVTPMVVPSGIAASNSITPAPGYAYFDDLKQTKSRSQNLTAEIDRVISLRSVVLS